MPIATDIAFALAVLAVISTHLPTALRSFLLTLAVVDDHFLLVFNGAPEDKVFTVPTVVAEAEWTVVLDTAAQTDAKVDEQHREVSGGYELAMPARSIAVLRAAPADAG